MSAIKKLTEPDQTILGHLDMKRKNIQSTKEREELEDWKGTIATKLSQNQIYFTIRLCPLTTPFSRIRRENLMFDL